MGTPTAVQCLRLCASNAGGLGSIPDWGMNISHVVPCHQKGKRMKQVMYSNMQSGTRIFCCLVSKLCPILFQPHAL